MAIIENLYTGDGTTVLFPFSFSYLDQQDVKVTVNSTLTTDFTFANDSTVEFNTAPANGAFIRIFRETPIDQAKATFFAGSAIRASDLNQNNTQLVFSAQEVLSRAVNRLGDVMAGILNMGGFKITNLATPTNAGDAVTKAFVDAAIAAGISDGNKGDVTVSGNGGTWTVNDGSITSSKILDGTIVDGDVSASAAIAYSKLALAGSVVDADIDASAAIAYSKLALAGSVVDADVNASAAIAGTKISPDFGSQNVVTTGTAAATSLIPTGSSVPASGVYLPNANELGFATNTLERARIDSSGKLLSPNGAAFYGTVSNSGNGAIMESGSNANGRFVKYADGTMICTRQIAVTPVANTPTEQVENWPAAFFTTNDLYGFATTSVVTAAVTRPATLNTLNTTTVGIVVIRSNTNITSNYVAGIGRWY